MSGIYIKGMEMPEHCGYCRFRYDGICHALQKTQYSMEECPLVPVPPHGELIDRDALADDFRNFIAMYDGCPFSQLSIPDKAERYALGDFKEHGYGALIKDDEPVKLSVDFCKKWKKYDTVLVDAEQYEAYCRIADLPLEPPKEE